MKRGRERERERIVRCIKTKQKIRHLSSHANLEALNIFE